MTSSPSPESEWANSANWGRGIFNFYFSKRDPRLWVPKRRPGRGWTLNMAHPRAGAVILGLILFVALIPAVASGATGVCAAS